MHIILSIIDDKSKVGEFQGLQLQSQKFALERRRGVGNWEKWFHTTFYYLQTGEIEIHISI